MSFADPVTGAPVDAWLFVAALSFSAYAYVEAFTDMTLGSWIDAHVHAFEAFDGIGPAARARQPSHRRVPVGSLRAGAEPGVCPPGRALRHRDRPGQGQETA